eukprot:7012-Rhodomonas_salina.1
MPPPQGCGSRARSSPRARACTPKAESTSIKAPLAQCDLVFGRVRTRSQSVILLRSSLAERDQPPCRDYEPLLSLHRAAGIERCALGVDGWQEALDTVELWLPHIQRTLIRRQAAFKWKIFAQPCTDNRPGGSTDKMSETCDRTRSSRNNIAECFSTKIHAKFLRSKKK